MTGPPAISVLMPVYNAGPYLAPAIDSILGQTFGDFELLLIDDGSTDGSAQAVAAQTDGRVRVFLRPHEGLVPTLNFGLAQARTPLVARMDADDVSLPQRLEVQRDFMRRHEEVVALGTAVQRIDADGSPIGPPIPGPQEHEDILWRLTCHSSGSGLHHPSVMCRREAALTCGGYRAAFTVCEDWDFWVRLARIGKLHALPEVLLLLRKHSGNVTVMRLAANLQGLLRAQVCYAVWRQMGVDPLDRAPALWRSAEERISQLIADHELLGVLQARVQLRQGLEGIALSKPLTVVARLVRHPSLFRGLHFHRIKDRIVAQVAAEIASELRAGGGRGP